MFSKADKTKVSTTATRVAPSLISNDLEIDGDLRTSGEVQIDGTVDGVVVCSKLMIGEKAVITGQIEANEVVIRGRVTGQVKAGSVYLAKTARVTGDIWHDSLAIEVGAFLEGHCKRNEAVQVPPEMVAATAAVAAPKTEGAAPLRPDVVAARQRSVQDGAGNMIAKTAVKN